jgi:hypothetical protein
LKTEEQGKPGKLTKFLCQELLYEYVAGTLDSARTRDVEEFLPTCRETQRELLNLKLGLEYAGTLAEIRLSDPMLNALIEFEPTWKRRLRHWTLWSSRRGWKLMPYIFVGAALALALVVFKPWRQDSAEVILAAESPAAPAPAPGPAAPAPAPAPGKAPPPETKVASNAPAPQKVEAIEGTPAILKAPLLPPPPSAVLPVPQEKAPKKVPAPLPENAEQAAVSPESKAEEAAADDEHHEANRPALKGSLTRGELVVEDFAMTWPVIRDKIVELGGKAAGSVELGWLRRKDQSYFHFSLPESNYADLQKFLKTFGPVQFHTEAHPRVMPRGQIRIILTVKDGETHEGEAEAP